MYGLRTYPFFGTQLPSLAPFNCVNAVPVAFVVTHWPILAPRQLCPHNCQQSVFVIRTPILAPRRWYLAIAVPLYIAFHFARSSAFYGISNPVPLSSQDEHSAF